MVLKIPITPELEEQLKSRAAAAGKNATEFAREAIEEKLRAPSSVDEILAPFRADVQASGMTDGQLDEFFHSIREEVWREKHGRSDQT